MCQSAGREMLWWSVLWWSRLRRLCLYRHGPQNVGATYDSDKPAVANDRDSLYAVARQQAGNFVETRILAHGYDRRRHDIACGALRRAQAGEKIRG